MRRETSRLFVVKDCVVYIVFVLLAPTLLGVSGVQITDLRVPSAVRNGTGSAAVLDCEYSLKQDEINQNSGLVVKWFFNSGPAPVYQWIIGKKPQDLGILKGKLNLKHRVSNNNHTMHRALYIVNPTTELSGEYKCFVSTFNEEDFMIKKMVVFAPETKLELMSHRRPDLDSLNVTCRAQGVYPEPKMALFKDRDRTKQSGALEGVTIEMSNPRSGVYDIVATKMVSDLDLQSPTVFDCELRIPDANYVVRKSIVLYPGTIFASTESRGDAVDGRRCIGRLLLTAVLLIVARH